MQATIHPSAIKGTIQAPSSKSLMQRALAAALLCKRTSYIRYHTLSSDDKAALNIIQSLGANIEYIDDYTICITNQNIHPKQFTILNPPPLGELEGATIHCGESGLAARMFTPIAALFNQSIHITGEGSLLKRPMDFFDTISHLLKVNLKSNNGYLPITIQGPLQPANIEIDGSISSQFLTGLLFAYSAANASNISIKVNHLNSKPYIDLTLNMLQHFGLKCPINKSYKEFYFEEKIINYPLSTINYQVEGDWSSAAFLLVASAITGPITVSGLNHNSAQADKAILQVLEIAGASIQIDNDNITVSSTSLQPFHFDATHCPDLFPPLVALAAYCKGTTTIKGAQRLIHKESNRAIALQQEFSKLGVQINIINDEMNIISSGIMKGGVVHAHNDHRIAMAFTVAGLKATDSIIIEQAQAVEKSYSGFYKDVQQLGVKVLLSSN